jgi:hypothetical protein
LISGEPAIGGGAGRSLQKAYQWYPRCRPVFFDGNQMFISRHKMALWPFGPFSEGTMMLHAATARAGVRGVGPRSDPIRLNFVPELAGAGLRHASSASHQFFFPNEQCPRFGPAPKICGHASFEEEGGNVGAGPQKSLTLFSLARFAPPLFSHPPVALRRTVADRSFPTNNPPHATLLMLG